METSLRRIIRQRLESHQRAGLKDLKRGVADEALLEALGRPNAPVVEAASLQTDAAGVGSQATAGNAQRLAGPKRQPIATQTTAPEPMPESATPAAASFTDLSLLSEQVAACVRCRELAETRTQTVFGVGDPNASIMFIGEAPGADEDRQGEPFVGRAGQLLDKIIEACRLTRDEIYIANILKCRPPQNRNPTSEEAGNCREYLDAQIRLVDPDYIVCWGSVAAQNLLDTKQAIGRMRGRFLEHGRARVLCTYHPSYLLRNPAAKKEVWKDMKFFRSDMGVDLG